MKSLCAVETPTMCGRNTKHVRSKHRLCAVVTPNMCGRDTGSPKKHCIFNKLSAFFSAETLLRHYLRLFNT
jgi:hypothetical protein